MSNYELGLYSPPVITGKKGFGYSYNSPLKAIHLTSGYNNMTFASANQHQTHLHINHLEKPVIFGIGDTVSPPGMLPPYKLQRIGPEERLLCVLMPACQMSCQKAMAKTMLSRARVGRIASSLQGQGLLKRSFVRTKSLRRLVTYELTPEGRAFGAMLQKALKKSPPPPMHLSKKTV
jgi:hypothetical protein